VNWKRARNSHKGKQDPIARAQKQADLEMLELSAAGARYLETAGIAGKPYCLWVDTEGHATEVLSGFGETLRYAEIVICELENTDLYNSGANADDIIQILSAVGHEIVFRDFQNYGACNIVSISKMVPINREILMNPAQKFIADISKLATSEIFKFPLGK
jgi:hypothetical protein